MILEKPRFLERCPGFFEGSFSICSSPNGLFNHLLAAVMLLGHVSWITIVDHDFAIVAAGLWAQQLDDIDRRRRCHRSSNRTKTKPITRRVSRIPERSVVPAAVANLDSTVHISDFADPVDRYRICDSVSRYPLRLSRWAVPGATLQFRHPGHLDRQHRENSQSPSAGHEVNIAI